MKHSITYDEWLGYVDGDLDPATMATVRNHIADCGECHTIWEDLLFATSDLRSAAHEFASASKVMEETICRSRTRVLARIHAIEAPLAVHQVAGGELSLRRLRHLQRIVAPTCGAHTAFHLIVAAVKRTSHPHDANAWHSFLEQLRDLTSAFCGRSTARLVWEVGNSLQ